MASTGGATASPRSQRRRTEIVDAASALFFELGYHRVGIDDVAAAVGITGGAIYKHFGGKQDLLAHAVDAALTPVERAIAGAGDLDRAIAALAAITTDHRRTGILVTREVRALDGPEATDVDQRMDAVRTGMSQLLDDRRPGLSEGDRDLLADGMLAVLASTAHHTTSLPHDRSVALLVDIATRVADADLPAPVATNASAAPTAGEGFASLTHRREMLIDAAIELFGQRGYWAATMDDLGARADISGPSIYQHFSSKADLLVAALTRGNEGLRLGLSRALAEGTDAASRLALLVDSYVDFVGAHPGLLNLLVAETLYLPELERASLRGMQQRYVGEWVHLVEAAHPGLSHPVARFTTHAVLAVVNDGGHRGVDDPARRHQVLTSLSLDLLLTTTAAELAG